MPLSSKTLCPSGEAATTTTLATWTNELLVWKRSLVTTLVITVPSKLELPPFAQLSLESWAMVDRLSALLPFRPESLIYVLRWMRTPRLHCSTNAIRITSRSLTATDPSCRNAHGVGAT